jgi:hypothetical protein
MVIVGVSGSLLVMLILPESVPVVVGENVTVKVALPAGAIVLGVVIPETPNGPALTEIREMVRLAPPALVILSVPLEVDPTVAVPKFKLVELTPICCGTGVAVPESATCSEEIPVSVVTVRVPVTLPEELGSNET